MKNIFLLAFIIALFSACNNKPTPGNSIAEMPIKPGIPLAPGILIANDSMPVDHDPLKKKFSIAIKTNLQTDSGYYDVLAVYNKDSARGLVRMPTSSVQLTPLLRHGDTANSYVVGFHFGNDTTFHDYFEISLQKDGLLKRTIKMEYIKAYTFE